MWVTFCNGQLKTEWSVLDPQLVVLSAVEQFVLLVGCLPDRQCSFDWSYHHTSISVSIFVSILSSTINVCDNRSKTGLNVTEGGSIEG